VRLRALAIAAGLLLSAGFLNPSPAAGAPVHNGLEPDLRRELSVTSVDARVPVVVRLRDRADLSGLPTGRAARNEAVVRRLQRVSDTTQEALIRRVRTLESEGEVAEVSPLWVFNAVALTATPAAVAELAARPEVAVVVRDEELIAPAVGAQINVESVTAPALWSLSARGAGVVIATLDTGVEVTHPDLASQFRGGTNSWFNPYSQFPTPNPEPDYPFDVSGPRHGHNRGHGRPERHRCGAGRQVHRCQDLPKRRLRHRLRRAPGLPVGPGPGRQSRHRGRPHHRQQLVEPV
jgi:subtilisin family serine protease